MQSLLLFFLVLVSYVAVDAQSLARCRYSKWSRWSSCTAPCNGGKHTRTRKRIGSNPLCRYTTQTRGCNIDPCPACTGVKCCKYGRWGRWGSCSKPCGGGLHTRTRSVTKGSKTVCKATQTTRSCNIDPCPIQCQYSKWTSWGPCSKPCDGGTHTRTRQLTKGLSRNCPLPLTSTRVCNIDPCPKPPGCTYNKWSRWGPCSKPCGGGTHFATRTVKTGTKCPDTKRNRACNIDPCPCTNPKDPRCCTYGPWTKWSACPVPCDGGKHTRSRKLLKGDPKICIPLSQSRLCNIDPCPPGPCKYNNWSKFGPCSKPCGGGTHSRTRTVVPCTNQTGKPKCPTGCKDLKNQRACNVDPCPKCVFNPWNAWGPCSAPCGGGKAVRTRTVKTNPPGLTCTPTSVTRACNIDPCPKCSYGPWSKWGPCSLPCGGGKHSRSRSKATGPPGTCPKQTKTRVCNIDPCPPTPDCTDPKNFGKCCQMGPWSKWSPCTAPCGGGTHSRTRTVIKGQKLKICQSVQSRRCNIDECPCKATGDPRPQCSGKCTYGPWTKWGPCSQPCDGGLMTRTRVVATGDSTKCPRLQDQRTCNLDPCPKGKGCKYGPWSKWAACNKPCGGGTHYRTRNVLTGSATKCPDQRQNRACNIDPCPCADPKVPCNCKYGPWSPWAKCSKECGGGGQGRSRPVISGTGCPSTQFRRCNIDPCPPKGCVYGVWGKWSPCTKICRGGTQTRTRTLSNGTPGKCPTSKTRPCNIDPCCNPKIDPNCGPCVYGVWTKWSPCPVPCGGGTHTRTRPKVSGNGTCTKTQKRLCNVDPCPPDCKDPKNHNTCCKYGPWTNWNPCSAPCGGGVHTRTRPVTTGSNLKICKHTTQSRQCNLDPCPCKLNDPRPVCNCTYAKWSKWSPCSRPCDGGLMSRYRPAGTGQKCPAQNVQRLCNLDPCPKNTGCTYGPWTPWSGCNKPCGTGTHYRTRVVQKGNDTNCPDQRQNRLCNVNPCPCVNPNQPCNCTYGAWNRWTPCTANCGGGQQSRTRSLGKGQDPRNCPGSKINRKCNLDPCICKGQNPPCCVYTPWAKWGDCTKQCGGGTHTRSRQITYAGGKSCNVTTQQRPCNLDPCCPKGQICCNWGPWGKWSPCTKTCGGGTQSRNRPLNFGDKKCNGQATRPCNIDPCPSTCKYGSWTAWGPCTKKCNGGTQIRTRTSPTGGQKCPPSSVQRPCNIDPCQTCKLGPWQKWGPCSQSCNGGTQSRIRTATGTDTSSCVPTKNTRVCNLGPCPKCTGSWAKWGPCSKSCGGGIQQRNCNNCGPKCPSVARRPCNIDPCCAVANAPWGKWSTCTKSCDGGTQQRFRNVKGPNCQTNQKRVCNIDPCPGCSQAGTWGNWAPCSKQCNGGIQYRTRTVPSASNCPTVMRRECNLEPCVCSGNPWSGWSVCTKDCGGGVQMRTRTDSQSNQVCSKQQRECNLEPCCPTVAWSNWGPCSLQCGGGWQNRTRGKVPKKGCLTFEKRQCNLDPCCNNPATCCKYTPWSNWGECTDQCGGGVQVRSRQFLTGPGKLCKNNTESRKCNMGPCCKGPQCCKYAGPWTKWGACTEECGGGIHWRSRTLSSGPKNCTTKMSRPCNLEPCCTKANQTKCCNYNNWGPWSPCSLTCGGGQQKRVRSLSRGPSFCTTTSQTQPCATTPCCKMGAWGQWSPCTKTCGSGTQTITRPRQAGTAAQCPPTSKSQPCNTKNCCVQSAYTQWGAWTKCTKQCGGGTQSRTRSTTGTGNGHCTDLKQSQPCGTQPCCKYGNWGAWGPCSKPCLGGTRTRTRPVYRGSTTQCPNNSQTGPCNKRPCCKYSQWTPWGPCDKPCGSGSQSRTRSLTSGNTTYCPVGPQTRTCNTKICCQYGGWQPWSPCTKTCGGGQQTRIRSVTAGSTSYCTNGKESQPCAPRPCCKYGNWSPFAPCAASCGGGNTQSTRPILAGLSSYCKNNTRTQPCATHTCCAYAPWTNWTPCTKTCGAGWSTRTRSVTAGNSGGKTYCKATNQKKPCNTRNCCTYGKWTIWSPCAKSCGGGTSTRTRPLKTGGYSYCRNATQSQPCATHTCCAYQQWTSWSPCSASCGKGTTTRTRAITAGAASYCPSKQTKPCNSRLCCTYGTWGPWSPCNSACGGGNSTRVRPILTGRASYCPKTSQGKPCATHECCAYGPWGSWSPCSQSCASSTVGQTTQTRPITGGTLSNCKNNTRTKTCNTQQCCKYGSWGPWAPCSKNCGGGTTQATRGLISGIPSNCPNTTTTKTCNQRTCCKYLPWGPWGPCSNICGVGNSKTRTRGIQFGAASYCKATTDSTTCNTRKCCAYGNWGKWSKCSTKCGNGTMVQLRSVTAGGTDRCLNTTRTKPCTGTKCPCAGAVLGQWSAWSKCNDYCYGTQSRTRTSTKTGKKCPPTKQSQECNTCCGDPSCDKDVCLNFCANGGKCSVGPNGKPRCECPEYWGGAQCLNKTIVDPCANWTCMYNGTCFTTYEGVPTCYCEAPHYGAHCHEVDPCLISPCENGGTCYTKFRVAYCKCSSDWGGTYCDQSKASICTPNPCNGGTCDVRWGAAICKCPAGKYGDFCNATKPTNATKCDQTALATCSRNFRGNAGDHCAFNAHLANCAVTSKCYQRLGVWCKGFFPNAPTCIPKACSSKKGRCRDNVYQSCYNSVEANKAAYPNQCAWEKALVGCTIDSGCTSLQSLVCTHAASICKKANKKLPKNICPSSMITSSLLEDSLNAEELHQFYKTFHLDEEEHQEFFAKKEAASTKTTVLVSSGVGVVACALVALAVAFRKKEQTYSAVDSEETL